MRRHALSEREGAVMEVPGRDAMARPPERHGPLTRLCNRFSRWRAAGVWGRILEAISEIHDGNIAMIESSCVRVRPHGAAGERGLTAMAAWDSPAAG